MQYNKYYIIVFLSLFLLSSCTNLDESVFKESSALRIEKSREQLLQRLSSAEGGWILEYFPQKELSYGGFSFVVSFSDSMQVTAQYEQPRKFQVVPQNIKNPNLLSKVTSGFDISQDAGLIIDFNVFNDLLHYFAVPSWREPLSKGGDFIFWVLDSPDPDVINLKGFYSGNYMRLVKLKKSAEDFFKSLRRMDLRCSSARSFALSCDGEPLDMWTDPARRVIIIKNEGEEDIHAPYMVIEQGIKFYQPIEIKGGTYSTLMFNAEEKTFISDDNRIRLNFNMPPFDFKHFYWTFNFDSTFVNSSAKVYEFYTTINEKYKETYSKDLEPSLKFVNGSLFFSYYDYFSTYLVKWEPVINDMLQFIPVKPYRGWKQGDENLQPFLDLFSQNSPYRVEKNEKVDRVKFISDKDPEFWFFLDK